MAVLPYAVVALLVLASGPGVVVGAAGRVGSGGSWWLDLMGPLLLRLFAPSGTTISFTVSLPAGSG